MFKSQQALRVPLPKGWEKQVRSAVLDVRYPCPVRSHLHSGLGSK